jgi:hypothetical protein
MLSCAYMISYLSSCSSVVERPFSKRKVERSSLSYCILLFLSPYIIFIKIKSFTFQVIDVIPTQYVYVVHRCHISAHYIPLSRPHYVVAPRRGRRVVDRQRPRRHTACGLIRGRRRRRRHASHGFDARRQGVREALPRTPLMARRTRILCARSGAVRALGAIRARREQARV